MARYRRGDVFGPMTRATADHRRIKYGSLTEGQFDDLERLAILGEATTADLVGSRRSVESVIRAMGRHMLAGWVERSDAVETWRLTVQGARVFGWALEEMDAMIGDGDEW
jgi:hypothetical protein